MLVSQDSDRSVVVACIPLKLLPSVGSRSLQYCNHAALGCLEHKSVYPPSGHDKEVIGVNVMSWVYHKVYTHQASKDQR